MKPQHGQLFATDLDEETLVRYVDRFLMFYIRTAGIGCSERPAGSTVSGAASAICGR